VNGNEVLFPSRKGTNQPIRAGQAWHIVKQAAKQAGAAERVATHSLRKTFAQSIYASTDHDIIVTQRALGHRSIQTTARYLDASEPEVFNAVMQIDGPELTSLDPAPAARATALQARSA
jgi:site-specific recombinase XerD